MTEKNLKFDFVAIDENEESKKTIAELQEIYKEMGQGDNLLSHSPSRCIEYPYALKYIKGERILDAGCGSSPMLLYLKRKGLTDLTGVDQQSAFENPTFSFKPEWEKQYGITYVEGNLINYKSKVFDTVYCVSVLEHIYRPTDRLKAIVNLWENVKDGGRLIITCDLNEMMLLGFFLTVAESAKLLSAMTYKNEQYGIVLEKVGKEGQAEWYQINNIK